MSAGSRQPRGGLVTKRAVALMDRVELEDKCHQVFEENQLLKKHAKAQEEKMKKMATKLLRLTADERRLQQHNGSSQQQQQLKVYQYSELEDREAELQARVRQLEKQNTSLKNKVMVMKEQAEAAASRRRTPYGHVPSRVKTGLSKKAFSTEDITDVTSRKTVSTQVSPGPVRYGHSLLEDARRDNQELEEMLLVVKEDLAAVKMEHERDKQLWQIREVEHEEELLKLQEQIQNQLTAAQKASLQENVELIKLQREMREKTTKLQTSESQYLITERSLQSVKHTNARLHDEIESLTAQIRQEQRRGNELHSQVLVSTASQQRVTELEEIIVDLKAERELLKQSNDRLMKSALGDRTVGEREWQSRRKTTEEKRLDDTVMSEIMAERNKLSDMLTREKSITEQLKSELEQMRASHQQLQTKHQSLSDKINLYTKDGTVSWDKVEEAVAFIKLKRERGENPLSFLQAVDNDEECKGSFAREVQELRVAHAETQCQLDKTRRLLSIQNTISKDCKREVEALQEELREVKTACEKRVEERTQLLDIKQTRIKKLESQLDEATYGKRWNKLEVTKFETTLTSDPADNIVLERDQNLLEVHVKQVGLNPKANSSLSSTSTPSLFLSLTLSGYETQVSPILHSPSQLDFNYTARFLVTVNDHFVNQLSNGSITVELHQAHGLQYHTIASTSLALRQLIATEEERASVRIHNQTSLTGSGQLEQCGRVGRMDYWMCLRRPVTQLVTHLHQGRVKKVIAESSGVYTPPADPTFNELSVTILSCSDLLPVKGHNPSVYVVYTFYSFPDHDTPVVTGSLSPLFNNTRCFPVTMNHHLHTYLSSTALAVYVFDDLDPVETNYLGLAEVSLLPLTQGHSIQDSFLLKNTSDSPAGTIELSITWRHTYTSPSPASHTPPTHTHTVKEEKRPLVPSDNGVLQEQPQLSPQLQVAESGTFIPVDTSSVSPTDRRLEQGSDKNGESADAQSTDQEAIVQSDVDEEVVEELDETMESVSVTVTEYTEEEEERDCEEDNDTASEDTMFEESVTQEVSTLLSPASELSPAAASTPARPSTITKKERDRNVDSSNPVTLVSATSPQSTTDDEVVVFSLTVISFTLGETCSLANSVSSKIFVEYQFLDYPPEELETPFSVSIPPPGKPVSFNFKKEFRLDPSMSSSSHTLSLLASALRSSDLIVPFTVVSDPGDTSDSSAECVELGVGGLNFDELLSDEVSDDECVEVDLEVSSPDEVIGFLTLLVDGTAALKKLNNSNY